MGLFIVVEGIDGAGKSTLSKALADRIHGEWTCFPQRNTFYGKLIDAWLKGQWSADWTLRRTRVGEPDGLLDAAVFQALQTVNRLEVAETITRARRHTTLVCDRYWPSGYAYGGADGLDPTLLQEIHQLLPQPDLYLLVDCPIEVAAERVKARGGEKAEVYESRGLDYMKKVQEGFYKLWNEHVDAASSRWVVVESGGSFDVSMQQAIRAVENVQRR